ncbi:phosphatidylglycerol lysyltransferase domain-containing protein [Mycoplasmoides pirum]|uniref:phosphatidylglycerol lysyltransferase domain-containing protein n=1 Tax=Mycoplasmoides pirum TaxID=2122 RepID=UPI000488B42A|nr:phosphatidylglycerol lysyltransferase domain-containing protein [Mycoplasmoides pirum]
MKCVNSENLVDFQNAINQVNSNNIFSAATYLSWSNFGVEITYEHNLDLDCVFLYCKYESKYWDYINDFSNKELEKWNDASHKYLLFAPIVRDDNSFLKIAKKQIEKFLNHKKNSGGLFMDDLTNEQVELLKTVYDVDVIFKNFSNYLYTKEQLETMAGKKMQKRRNHLNFYLNNYASKTTIKKIHEIDFEEIINFLNHWGTENGQFDYESELKFLKQSKELIAKQIFQGIGLFLDNQLIGITISFQHNDYCEILIEHADKSKRGSYQYLLSNNIKINHKNVKWIDRQDDVWSPIIDLSKRMYHPVKIVEKNVVHIKLKSNHVN